MRCLYIPNSSFKDEQEVVAINKKLSMLREVLFDEISDDVEVWIVGNKDQRFFRSIMQGALNENKVLDPSDELPINRCRELTHVAVVNYKYSNLDDITRETIYGNTDYLVCDFINVLLHRLKLRFPNTNPDIRENQNYSKPKCNLAA